MVDIREKPRYSIFFDTVILDIPKRSLEESQFPGFNFGPTVLLGSLIGGNSRGGYSRENQVLKFLDFKIFVLEEN